LDMPPKMKVAVMCAAKPDTKYLFSSSGGYGFIATLRDLMSRQKAGKAFMTLSEADILLQPAKAASGDLIVALGSNGKLLLFPISEMKALTGGKGVIILALNDGETLIATAVLPKGSSLQIKGTSRGSKLSQLVLKWEALQPFVSHRARRGMLAPVKFKPEKIEAC
jgi:topoisomerase IV subunit A